MEFPKELSKTSSFRALIDNNCVYVDKTDIIAKFAVKKGPFVFFRPRGFGKSLLVSTLYELFKNGVESFCGLKIKDLWKDKTYKVIKIDFSRFKESSSTDSFKASFNRELFTALKNANLSLNKVQDNDVPSDLLSEVLMNINSTDLVLLIDNYDAPLTAVLGDKAEFASRQKILSNFYSTVKSYQGVFRFVFITGEINYFSSSTFSSFNHLEDLFFNSDYGALLGFTEDDLEHYFSLYTDRACEVLNKLNKNRQYTHDNLLSTLKSKYGDYCFDNKAKEHIYNPSFIVNFFSELKEEHTYRHISERFRNSNLENFLRQALSKDIKEQLQRSLDLDTTIYLAQANLYPQLDTLTERDLYAILYQLGYLCIKASRKGMLSFSIPNLAVKHALKELIKDIENRAGKSALDG